MAKDKAIVIRLSQSQKERIDEYARMRGISVATFLRGAAEQVMRDGLMMPPIDDKEDTNG